MGRIFNQRKRLTGNNQQERFLSLTGYALVEAILTISLMAMVMVAMIPFVRTVHTSWNLGDRKTELLQNGRVGLAMISDNLRQAKRITGIPATGSGNYVKFRNIYDNQTVIFYHNVPSSAYYIAPTGLIADNDLVMRIIDAGTANSLLAKSLTAFQIDFKNETGAAVVQPYQVTSMDIAMNLTDPQGFIPDVEQVFSRISLRPSVRIDRSVWLTSGNNIMELSLDNTITGFSSPNAVSVNKTLMVNGRETVWVADTTGNRVRRIYWNGSAWTYDTITGFSSPSGVSVNPVELVNGRETCWVADTSGNRIRRIVWTGSAWSYSAGGGMTLTGFSGPRSVSVNTNELVNSRNTCWVADTDGDRIRKIYWSVAAYTYTNLNLGSNSSPYSASVNTADNTCWVARSGPSGSSGRRVSRIAANCGSVLYTATGFVAPNAVSVNPNTGECWVADTGNNLIKKLSSTATLLLTLSGFSAPNGVDAVSVDNSCWVADTNNNQVVRLDAEGNEEFRISGFSGPLAATETP